MVKILKCFICCYFLLVIPPFTLGQPGNVGKFGSLSPPEKRWVIFHPFIAAKTMKISEKAREISLTMMRDTMLDSLWDGGRVDAFRHTLWMAMLVQKIQWRKAWRLGIAHEKGNKQNFERKKIAGEELQDSAAVAMDIWNNSVGIDVGMENIDASVELLIEKVKEAVLTGRCRIIRRNNDRKNLDPQGNVLFDDALKGIWNNGRTIISSR